MNADFRITIQTEQASLFFENLPPMPVPRVGDEVYVGGEGSGLWLVQRVVWAMPQAGAMTPTMEAIVTVEWSENNGRPAPVYDEDRGWAPQGETPQEANDG